MYLFEITYSEEHPAYANLAAANAKRVYGFLDSMIDAALAVQRPLLTHAIIKAINYHAIAGLHARAGEYRSHEMFVRDRNGTITYTAPHPAVVHGHMDDFVDQVNRRWTEATPIRLAAFALWRINFVHPFINGNGRTARSICYYILCTHLGGRLPGDRVLPEIIAEDYRAEYVAGLKVADKVQSDGTRDMSPLEDVVANAIRDQLSAALQPRSSV